MPHIFIILMLIMLIVVVLSWIIPSGNFERVVDSSGNEVVNPDKFNYSENENPIGFMDYFKAIFDGIVQAGEIIASLLICSGVLKLFDTTGTFSAAIHRMLGSTKGDRSKELAVIVVFYTVFAIMGVLGYGENSYPFYAITCAVIMALGYDRVAGAGVIMISSSAGFTCGMLNLFTTGVSQEIVGLPLFSGIGYRALSFVVFYVIGLFTVLLYCRRIKKDPSKSYVRDEYMSQINDGFEQDGIGEHVVINGKHIAALIALGILIIAQGVGCVKYQWGMGEVAALYVILAIFLIVIFRLKPGEACDSIVVGAGEILGACIVTGLARAVMVLMTQANILDTIVYYMGNALEGKSAALTLLLILAFVTALNFFVVSGSGKAVMMMPILSPLGKMLGINQQVMVLTYQFGDGFTNYLWPAGALVGCSLCKLDYGAWIRFAWWALGAQILSAYVLIVIADLINYGPF